MLTNPTIEKLKKMKLNRMAEEYANPPEGAAAMNFDDRFGLMVEKEWLAKHNRRINNLMKNARFRISNACLEDIRWEGRNPECRQVLNALWPVLDEMRPIRCIEHHKQGEIHYPFRGQTGGYLLGIWFRHSRRLRTEYSGRSSAISKVVLRNQRPRRIYSIQK